jgi:proteasome lid subunit RPN8/RPN11
MVAHAREARPHECCGLLAGTAHAVSHMYRVKNIVAAEGTEHLPQFDDAKVAALQRLTPEERAEIAFVMDAQEQSLALKDMRQRGIELQAFYHSHPLSPARPSVTDIKNALEFESYRAILNLPRPFHIVISLEHEARPDVRAFVIEQDGVRPVEIKTI